MDAVPASPEANDVSAGESFQLMFQVGDHFACITQFELQFMHRFLVEVLHLFLQGFDLFSEGGFLFGCGWGGHMAGF